MTWKDLPRNPSSATLRQFAALWLVIFGIMGYSRFQHGDTRLGVALMAMAAVGGIVGLAAPRVMRPIFVGWLIVVFPIGWFISHALLAVLFACLFAPLGLLFRWMKRDALRLRPTDTTTYWRPKPAAADIASYYRQF